ncbi:hypothetical protein PENTCL1PPCAC_22051, partial [Pristionchus entomophagus]
SIISFITRYNSQLLHGNTRGKRTMVCGYGMSVAKRAAKLNRSSNQSIIWGLRVCEKRNEGGRTGCGGQEGTESGVGTGTEAAVPMIPRLRAAIWAAADTIRARRTASDGTLQLVGGRGGLGTATRSRRGPSSARRVVLQRVGRRMDLEAVQSGYELDLRLARSVLGMHEEEHVGEASAEVSTVRVLVFARAREVDVAAARAIQLHHRLARHVRQADGQHRLVLAVDAHARPEVVIAPLQSH